MLFPEALASATVVAEAALLAVLFRAFLFHPVDGPNLTTTLLTYVIHPLWTKNLVWLTKARI